MADKYLNLLIIFLLGNINYAISQSNISPTSGCAPLINVSFTTTNSAYTNINWDFGDGSSSINPTSNHTYPNPGTYTVVFSAMLSGNPVSQTTIINVYDSPTAGFDLISQNTGCVPFQANFQDNSTSASSSNIVEWIWTYGDGNMQTTTSGNISHTYNYSGIYDVSLEVTDNNGCSDFILLSSLLTLSSAPTASILSNFNTLTNCDTPMTISFDANAVSTSSISNSIFYSWDFDNGSSSQLMNNQVEFYPGTYTITLTVSDEFGCSAYSYYTINVIDPDISFDLYNSVDYTICNIAKFNSSCGNENSYWNYGDGTSGFDSIHLYTSPGVYYVHLSCNVGPCDVDTTIPITVEEVISNFTFDTEYSCSSPVSIQFTDSSTNAVSWQYIFGDGTESNNQNPLHLYHNQDTGLYDMPELQVFYPSLIAYSSHGCYHYYEPGDSIVLDMPVAMFMPNVNNGCAPLTVTFSDSSYSPGNIISWYWDFGDSTSTTTYVDSAVHTFLVPGIYDVYLTITDDLGCSDISYPITITVNYCSPPPPGDTIVLDVCACFPECSGSPPDYYTYYNAMYTGFTGCTENHPSVYTFATDTGIIDILFHYYYNGVLNIYSVTNPLIDVQSPLGHISYDFICSEPHGFLFHSNAIDTDSIFWDFGDSTFIDTGNVINPFHTYADTGDYVVILEMFNFTTGCVLADSMKVYVRDIFADFHVDSILCANTNVLFDAGESEDVFTSCYSGYEWDFGDLSPIMSKSSPETFHSYSESGTYYIELSVKDINGCIDYHYDTVKVYNINANLEFTPASFCAPDSVHFTDLSWADTTISNWTLNPGFGNPISYVPPSILYESNVDTVYYITFTVEDVLGCTDSWLDSVELSVLSPLPSIMTSSNDVCPGDQPTILVSGIFQSVAWHIEDSIHLGNYCAHQFNEVGYYDVSVVISDFSGCQDSIVLSDYIHVHPLPDVYFYSDPSEDTLCLPVQITFTDSSVVDSIGTRVWNFYNSATINSSASVSWPYEIPGTYQVSLLVESAFGCKDSATKTFTIEGPLADFNISPPIICQGEEITLELIDTSNVYSWFWDLGDGQVDSTNFTGTITYTYPAGFYPSGGQTYVSLIFSSENCQDTRSKIINFHPEVLADFISTDHPDLIICHGDSITFLNTSVNADNITWSFNNGSSYTNAIVSKYYPNSGFYSVTLNASDNTFNCNDETTKIVEVRADAVLIAPYAAICLGDSYTMNVSAEGGITSYFWTPEEQFSNQNEAHPIVFPTQTQTYYVDIVDGYGCSGSGSQTVVVITDPPAINWDTIIIIGQSVHLDAWFGDYINYTWNPDTTLDNYYIPDPWALTFNDNTYTVNLIDTVTNCFDVTNTYTIIVKPETSFDLPSVFTPNGDMINDIFYLQGWGIKEIVEFKIYNRWGELVYYGNDINSGWDGTYKGKDQPNDTYIYIAKVKTWLDQILEKRGYINLIR